MNKTLFLVIFILCIKLIHAQDNLLNTKGVPYLKEGKWGIMNRETLELMIEPNYDSIDHFPNSYQTLYRFYKNDKVGALKYGTFNGNNIKGEIIPAEYDRISSIRNVGYYISKDEKVGLTNPVGNIILSPKFNRLSFDKRLDVDKKEKNNAFFIINEESYSFDGGVFLMKEQRMVIPQEYKIEDLDYNEKDSISKALNKEVYKYLFTNKSKQSFVADTQFNLIKVEYEPNRWPYPEKAIRNRAKPKIHYSSLFNYLPRTCEIENQKTYKSNQKNKYTLTENCYSDFRIIKSKKGKYGLISRDNPNFKQPLLEPKYDSINVIDYYPSTVFLITKQQNGKATYSIYRPESEERNKLYKEFKLNTFYAKVSKADNFVELEKENGLKDFLFYDENGKHIKLSAKSIEIIETSKCSNCLPAIYRITKDKNIYFYMDANGVVFNSEFD